MISFRLRAFTVAALAAVVCTAPAQFVHETVSPFTTRWPWIQRVPGQVVYETVSSYHNVRVVDADETRTMYYDDTRESRMSLLDPNTGHLEYTEYFHMVWLWNADIRDVLMLGLGGGSTQRTFTHYYPDVTVSSVEIDPAVGEAAKRFFHYAESDRQKLYLMDGRMFLRRSTEKYDAIILDAFTQGRYGASIPAHLVTREFFELSKAHLTPNGVLAYNVMSTLRGCNADIAGADSSYKGPYVSDAIRRPGTKPGERRQNESGMLANRSGPSSSGQLNLTL